jgi:hypothetical protein
MEPIKTFNIGIGANYRDRKDPLSWEMRQFAEIVFIDKTRENTAPQLYQLKDDTICLEELAQWKTNAAFFPKESFLLVGEIASIDKKRKQILLTNQNVVAYRYLVIAAGTMPVVTVYGDEFTAGINALIDALRIKAKIPSSFADPSKLSEKSVTPSQTEGYEGQIDKIVQPSIHSATAATHGCELNAINKRLYEVQL